MAHFIKLSSAKDEAAFAFINIDHITSFRTEEFGSTVVINARDYGTASASCSVKETPDQILALIAEAQVAK